MKLAFAFLADAAVITPDGKIQVQGGDLDKVLAPSYPAVHPTLSLVVKVHLDPEEYDKTEQLQLEGLDPAGHPWFPPATTTFTPKAASEDRDLPGKFAFVFNMPMVFFPTPGRYVFRILHDGTLLGEVPLHAILIASPQGSEAPGAQRAQEQEV